MLEKDDNNYSESLLSSRNSGEIINTNSNSYTLETKDSFDEQIDQEQMIVLLQELKADYTTVLAILAGDAFNFREKDKFDIVKFTIKIKAVYDYTWEVYQKPADIKKKFTDIHSELSKNFMEPSGKEANIFSTMAEMPAEASQIYMNEIVEHHKAFFKNPKIYNTLAFKV